MKHVNAAVGNIIASGQVKEAAQVQIFAESIATVTSDPEALTSDSLVTNKFPLDLGIY